mmetsp:Transcript_13990/g.16920  ORF Transcript_13990/g.16920 Transcript_13990/m.16920 type:complete len:672 (+) Transcript_13990:130-2145(+)|eukprot:CAMPEP_0197848596 /NCGR_PEP_ID=MMETSP1438-20131217/9280_1 /TAXON_ID=1461541 /ORGANISM="Pterosperma sp., Strain CCMP1384" /LENGTH=671 /DNA_ID=CAMNT_0043460923 /DNA_START=130 /DNA_END=2145 /DNA_ORIENTATION=+
MNPRYSPYILGVFALIITAWLFEERQELNAQTSALQHDLDSLNTETTTSTLAGLGYADAGPEEKKLTVSHVLGTDNQDDDPRTIEQIRDDIPEPESKYRPDVNVTSFLKDLGPCVDASERCGEWARAGECLSNAAWMIGQEGSPGHCRVSCGECEPDSNSGPDVNLPDMEASSTRTRSSGHYKTEELRGMEQVDAAEEADASAPICRDLSPNCKVWQMHGECERNPEYMVGGDGYEGQCVLSCGKCPGRLGDYGKLNTEHKEPVDEPTAIDEVAKRALRWPQKRAQAGRVCVGLSTTACTHGLYQPAVEKLTPTDRSTVIGVGGPTGCQEAWATLMTTDDEIAGVLVLVFSLRKLSNLDRDIVVFVTPSVTGVAIEQLLTACVIVKLVTEPMDPATHMGFVKITMWLAIEYTKLVFVEHDTWFRTDPSPLFEYSAPAAIKTAPHPRLLNEMYGSYLQVIEPSRQTFYDMLAKVGTIDSAEVVDEHGTTVFTERLFFSGYWERWNIIPNKFLEQIADVVAVMIPELTNTRLRKIIKSMPPYSQDTVVDYDQILAGGVYANTHVKPWIPGWRIPCAWECRYRKYQQLYEALTAEWWQLYYNLVGMSIPQSRALYTLTEEHDVLHLYDEKEYKHCLPYNCEVPDMPGIQVKDAEEAPKAVLKAPKRGRKRGKFM